MWIYDNTPLVRVSDQTYPVYFPQVRQENPNTGFPIPISEELLALFDYAPVYDDGTQPEGDVVTEGTPELREDGKWYKTWTVRSYTEEERLAELKLRKEVLYNRAYGLYNDEVYNGLVTTYDGRDFTASIDINSVVYLRGIISNWDSETEPVLVKGQYEVIALDKSDTSKQFVQSLLDDYKLMYRNYLNFLYQTTSTLQIPDLPELPSTFRG